MDDWTRKSRETFHLGAIAKIWGSKSPEREKNKKKRKTHSPNTIHIGIPTHSPRHSSRRSNQTTTNIFGMRKTFRPRRTRRTDKNKTR